MRRRVHHLQVKMDKNRLGGAICAEYGQEENVKSKASKSDGGGERY